MWYTVNIYLETRLPIHMELKDDELHRLVNEWEESRLHYESRLRQYEGRGNDSGWMDKYVPTNLIIDLGNVCAIEWHEVVEEEKE